MNKERVLITGGAGYLGSVITKEFLGRGYSVTCLDNLMYEQQSPLLFSGNNNFNFVYGDVRNKDLLKECLKKADIILPLAAIVGMPACERMGMKDPKMVGDINTEQIRFIDEIRTNEQRLVFPTTNSGYGTTEGDKYCTENTPLNPISIYGATKVEAEKVIRESDKNAVIFRLATVFGLSPRMRLDLLVNDFSFRSKRDGKLEIYEPEFIRNFVHIKDVAGAFLYGLEKYDGMSKPKVFNVGLPEANLSKIDLARKIKEQLPDLEINISDGKDPDKRNYIVSNERLLSTGFRFSHTLEEGIGEILRSFDLLNVPSILKNSRNI